MVKIMENPIKMDDLGVPPFKETPICLMSAKLPLHFLPQILETRLDMFHLLHDAWLLIEIDKLVMFIYI